MDKERKGEESMKNKKKTKGAKCYGSKGIEE